MEKIENEALVVLINEVGAELLSISSKTDGTEYLWNGDKAFWIRHAPLLFPFVGRLFQSRYLYKGKSYEMSSHGFAAASHFEVMENRGDSVVMCIKSNAETAEIYPFNFILRVEYKLSGKSLIETVSVENPGPDTLIYGIGFHPGFSVPLEKGLTFEDYTISFPAQKGALKRRVFSENHFDLASEELLDEGFSPIKLHHDLFDDDAIILSGTGGTAVISSEKGMHSISVEYGDAPWLGIWHTVGKPAPFVCIEPWWTLPGMDGIVTDLEKKEDVHFLSPENLSKYSIKMTFN